MITDLNAEGEPIPINPPKEDWLGHTVIFFNYRRNLEAKFFEKLFAATVLLLLLLLWSHRIRF